jgi:hypothetical protein
MDHLRRRDGVWTTDVLFRSVDCGGDQRADLRLDHDTGPDRQALGELLRARIVSTQAMMPCFARGNP